MAPSSRRRENIERIHHLPEYAAAAVAGLTEAQLDTPYREGGWTVRQVIHHLADAHLNGFTRMKLALTEERPTLKTYDQDAWALTADAHIHPMRASLGILEGLHARWATLLENLPEEVWARTALHPEAGEMDLDRMLAIYAGHGDHHVAQITGLREARGW
jgi:uncharacterized damage-inducible protein DinB